MEWCRFISPAAFMAYQQREVEETDGQIRNSRRGNADGEK